MSETHFLQHRLDTERAKSRFALSDIIGRHVKLRKAGNERVGLCPFHEEKTPSFRVNDAKGLYICFGCGASGDAITYLVEKEGRSFVDAVKFLLGDNDLPSASPRDHATLRKSLHADKQAAIMTAQLEWHEAKRSVIGTPAEAYLASRGIVGPFPKAIRFARVPIWRDRKTGARGRCHPALLLGTQDRNGKLTGVQHVFLTEAGRKAQIANPKLSLGAIRGCSVRLDPPARRVILIEGPEDGLTIRQNRLIPNVPVWITLGTGSMPHVDLPDEVRHVTLAGDNNAPGRAAIIKSAENFVSQGRYVDVIFPDARFEDFNDQMRGILIES